MKIDWKSFTKKRGEKDKNNFPTGSIVYLGKQGRGKTLSMVHDCFELKKQYPDMKIYSNLIIKGLNDYTHIKTDDDLARALTARPPRQSGTLIMLDEAHLFFNKKKGIPIEVLTAISQQRKDKRRMAFTSQIWEELDLSVRKQVKYIMNCNKYGILQINYETDGETLHWNNLKSQWEAEGRGYHIFKHTKELYEAFDTYQKILRNNEYRAGGGTPKIINFGTP